MLSLLTHSLARIPVTQRDRLATALAHLPALDARRKGHRESVLAVLSATDGWLHREAVRRHFVWALEFLAEMGGHRHPVEDRTVALWDPRDRARLIVTAHCGNWIVGARALARTSGPVHTVSGVQLQRGWQAAIRSHLRGQGIELTNLAGLRKVLRSGGTVVLHLDGQAGPYRPRGIPVGVRSAALLAAESGAAVYAATCARSGVGRFVLEGTRLTADVAAGRDSRDRIEAWEQAMLRTLREWVERDPADWLLFSPDHLGQNTIRVREA
jgi:hypothetical protein